MVTVAPGQRLQLDCASFGKLSHNVAQAIRHGRRRSGGGGGGGPSTVERCAAGVEGKERSMWKLNATCAGKKGGRGEGSTGRRGVVRRATSREGHE